MIDLTKVIDLPDAITVAGKSYCINTDYQFFVAFIEMAKNSHRYEDYNFMYRSSIPKDLKQGFEKIKDFASPRRELPRDIGDECTEILLDYGKDGELIYSAFWQCYGIDLKAQNLHLHWYKFQALLAGLQDTKLNKIMEFRAYNPKETDGKEFRKYMLQQKAMWQIEKGLTPEEKAAVDDFDSLLK